MTTYNGGKYLRAQLDSFVAQSRQPDEVVICDDRSTDDTQAIVGRFAATAPFPVRFIVNEENLGIVRNFAKAVSIASGDIILISDQDDVWDGEKLAKFERAFAQDPEVGLVFCDADVVDEDLSPLGYTFWQRISFSDGEQARFGIDQGFDVLLKHCFVAGATLAIRSKLRPLLLPFPDVWLYDSWLAICASAASKSRIIGESLNKYRQHRTNAVGAQRKSVWRRYVEARRGVDANYYLARATEYIVLRDRLLQAPDFGHASAAIAMIEAKIDFCRARSKIRSSHLLRLPCFVKELASGRYHRYSHGWKSALLDLLI